MPRLKVRPESWPFASVFTISRGSQTTSEVVVVTLTEPGAVGRGECVPYPRYGESVAGVIDQIESLRSALESGLDRAGLQDALPPGAARNALDCAYWDLEAKQAGKRAWEIAALPAPMPLITAYTISLDTPEKMGATAAANAQRPLLKLKLTGADDIPRVQAVHDAAPSARLVVDANEGWTVEDYATFVPRLAELGVTMIEQPLPAAQDYALAEMERPVPVCADESCHDTESLLRLGGRYDLVNIKLDKTGGLTEALRLKAAAMKAGFGIMVGCMVGTSLAMAPATLLAQGADVVDLDGPLLLASDRPNGLRYEGSRLAPPDSLLWG